MESKQFYWYYYCLLLIVFPVSLRIVEQWPGWTQTNKDEIFMPAGLLTEPCGILLAFIISNASMRYCIRRKRDLSLQVNWQESAEFGSTRRLMCFSRRMEHCGASWGYRLLPRIKNRKSEIHGQGSVQSHSVNWPWLCRSPFLQNWPVKNCFWALCDRRGWPIRLC